MIWVISKILASGGTQNRTLYSEEAAWTEWLSVRKGTEPNVILATFSETNGQTVELHAVHVDGDAKLVLKHMSGSGML